MVESADPETSISEVARCNGGNRQSAFKFGSDSLLMQFERCLALWLGENQRHAASTPPLQSGAAWVCCRECVLRR
ncbi:hypothetical protein NLM33_34590 [Bradyrhizobium sp. CCGUVB1N3]|nr:hypothetical protein [Bradyrhizobium sp. CCGUVB1N3]